MQALDTMKTNEQKVGPSHEAMPDILQYVLTCMVQNVVSLDVDKRKDVIDCKVHKDIRSKPFYKGLRDQYVALKDSGIYNTYFYF